MGGASGLHPHPSELLHLNQACGAGLDRMVSIKGGLRRVVIQQLMLLGIRESSGDKSIFQHQQQALGMEQNVGEEALPPLD